MNDYLLSHLQLFATPWTIPHQTPLSMEFSRKEYWSGLPFSFPGDPLDPGIEPASPAWAGRFFTIEPPGKPQNFIFFCTSYTYLVSFILKYLVSLVLLQTALL